MLMISMPPALKRSRRALSSSSFHGAAGPPIRTCETPICFKRRICASSAVGGAPRQMRGRPGPSPGMPLKVDRIGRTFGGGRRRAPRRGAPSRAAAPIVFSSVRRSNGQISASPSHRILRVAVRSGYTSWRRAHATLPGRGAQPPTRWCERRRARSPAGGTAAMAVGLPRPPSRLRRARLRRATATCRRRSRSGDRPCRSIFAGLVGVFGGLGLTSAGRSCSAATAAAADARPAPRPGPHRRAARGRPADHRHRRRSAPTGRSCRRSAACRAPPTTTACSGGRADREGPARASAGVLGLRGAAVRHRLGVASYPVASSPACTRGGDAARRRRRRGAGARSTSGRPAGRRWNTGCSARSTRSASGSSDDSADGHAARTSRSPTTTRPTSRCCSSRKPCCRSARRCRRSGPGRRRAARSSRRRRRCRARASSSPAAAPRRSTASRACRTRRRSYLVGAIVLLALAAGLFWFAR